MASYVGIYEALDNENLIKRIHVCLWRLAYTIWKDSGATNAEKQWAKKAFRDQLTKMRLVILLIVSDPGVDPSTATDVQLQTRVNSLRSQLVELET